MAANTTIYYTVIHDGFIRRSYTYGINTINKNEIFDPDDCYKSLWYTTLNNVGKYIAMGRYYDIDNSDQIATLQLCDGSQVHKKLHHPMYNTDKYNIIEFYSLYEFISMYTIKLLLQNGLILQCVCDQTPKICMVAVQQNRLALKYLKKQTHDLCMEAVRHYGGTLQCVKKQTQDMCMAAVSNDGCALIFVKHQTQRLCMVAVLQNRNALQFVKDVYKKIVLSTIK